jgi:altronate dehydratase
LLVREMAWYDAYLKRGSADRSANTTPGKNLRKNGLTSGLVYAATPASDFITVSPDAGRGEWSQKTWAEHWKLHNALVLFNPAPVT